MCFLTIQLAADMFVFCFQGFFFFYVLVFNLEKTKQTTIPAMIVAHFISHCADLPEHSSQSRLVL